MKEIYISLTQHSHLTYVMYTVNRMAACSHIQQVNVDVFECAPNGTVELLKDGMSLQDVVNKLFEGITRRDMTSLGLASFSREFDLFENEYS